MKPVALALLVGVLANCGARPSVPEPVGRVGAERCGACHAQEAKYCRYGAHRALDCESCHGPGGAHAAAKGPPRPTMSLGDVGLCMSCHREAIRSFEDHLTTLEREHRIKLDREKSGTDCVYCHDPHLLE